MAKKRRRRSGKGRNGFPKGQTHSNFASTNQPLSRAKRDVNAQTKDEQRDAVPSGLLGAIRLTAIITFALLILSLMTRAIWHWPIPNWFQPILEAEVAVLSLSAGHLALIGIHIGTGGRSDLSKSALSIAALATAFAGFRAIGESTPANVITLLMFFLTVLAIWPEKLIALSRWIGRHVWSWCGLAGFMLAIAAVITCYFQAHDENYIKNWILIPFGIIVGIAVSIFAVWILIRLAYRYVPRMWSWLRSRVVAILNRVARHR